MSALRCNTMCRSSFANMEIRKHIPQIGLAFVTIIVAILVNARTAPAQTDDSVFDYRAWGVPIGLQDWNGLALSNDPRRLRLARSRSQVYREDRVAPALDLFTSTLPKAYIYTLLPGPHTGYRNPKLVHSWLHESAFLHTTDPASLVAFPLIGQYIELHWMPDRRFGLAPRLATEEYPVQENTIYRSTSPNGPFVEIARVSSTENVSRSYVDIDQHSEGSTYYYCITSGIHAYSDTIAVQYSSAATQLPAYWLHDVVATRTLQGVPPNAVAHYLLSVSVGSYQPNAASPSTITMHVRPPSAAMSTPLDYNLDVVGSPASHSNYRWTYAFSRQDVVDPIFVGGYAFAFGNSIAGTQSLCDGRYFTSQPNNRITHRLWNNYQMNVDSPDYLSAYVVEMDSLLSLGSVRHYDGVEGDTAEDYLDAYAQNVYPRNYIESDYRTSFEEMLAQLRGHLAQRTPAVSLLINGIRTNFGAVCDAAIREHFAYNSSWSTVITQNAWASMMQAVKWAVANYTGPAGLVVANTSYPENFAGEELQTGEDRGPSRLFVLGSYLLIMEDNVLLSATKVDLSDRRVSFYPEWQINMGADLGDAVLPPAHPTAPNPDKSLNVIYEDQLTTDGLATRDFVNGHVAVNFLEYKGTGTLRTVSFEGTKYRLCVDSTVEQFCENGRFWTVPVTNGDVTIEGGQAAILLNEPVRSPETDPEAIYPLFSVPGATSVLAVHASHWDGSRLWVEIDGSAVGLDAAMRLADDGEGNDLVADDGIYTSASLNVSASAGLTYSLPVYARGDDGIAVWATVSVQVVGTPPAMLAAAEASTNHYGLNYTGRPYSSVTMDYNRDGLDDLLITVRNGLTGLYRRNNDAADAVPTYLDRRPYDMPGLNLGGYRGIANADFNNDGYTDVFMAHKTTPKLYLNNASANHDNTFYDVGQLINLSALAADSWCGAWGDYNVDGCVDLFIGRAQTIANHGSNPLTDIEAALPGVLLRCDVLAGGTFSDQSAILGSEADRLVRAVSATWGDVNRDGMPDLFVGQAGPEAAPVPVDPRQVEVMSEVGRNRLFVQQAGEVFVNEWSFRRGSAGPGYLMAAKWSDMDNDGDGDLVACGPGGAFYLQRNADGVFERGFLPYWHTGRGIAALDFDLDGKRDLLVLPDSSAAAPLSLYWNRQSTGPAAFADVAPFMAIDGFGANGIDGATATDFNSDGDLDLYLGKDLGSHQYLIQNKSATGGNDLPQNHWAGIDLVGGGVGNNVAAIGASVSVNVGDVTQTLWVDGGSGRGGQDAHTLIFGLGPYSESTIGAVVTWPNGRQQEATLDVGQVNVVTDLGRDPQIDGASLSATAEPYPGNGVTWVFNWKTRYPSIGAKDKVRLKSTYDAPGAPPGDCQIGAEYTWLMEGVAGVTVTSEEQNGWYHHQLRWERPCMVGCTYWYQVYSSSLVPPEVSAPSNGTFKRLIVPVCIVEDPDPDPEQE